MSNLTYLTPAQRTARDVWTSGNYPEVAERLIRGFGPVLVDELQIGPGQRVLDVACGAGNVAIPAALTGADVTGLDIAPALLEQGAANAWAADVDIQWLAGDAPPLPFHDAGPHPPTTAPRL